MSDYNKYYARNEEDNEQYSLKSYWTSSNTVEFNNEQTLEQYKTSLENQLNGKCDSIEYDIDDGKLYLYSNDIELDNEDLRIRTKPNIELGDIENFSIRLSNGRARICWSDPLDVEFASLKIIEWAGTKIVRKTGSAPENPTDGTVILDSQNRDEYNNVPFFDTIQTDTCYYYRLFPYDTEGNYYGKTCGVIYSPIPT